MHVNCQRAFLLFDKGEAGGIEQLLFEKHLIGKSDYSEFNQSIQPFWSAILICISNEHLYVVPNLLELFIIRGRAFGALM